MRFLASLSLAIGALYMGCVGDDPTGSANAVAVDGGSIDDAGCTPGCADANTLRTCRSADEPCLLGCLESPEPHCGVMQPTTPVKVEDFSAAGVEDVVVSDRTEVDTDTGAIRALRAANVDPLTVKSLTVADTLTLLVGGSVPLAVVAAGPITLLGVIDARGHTGEYLENLCGDTGVGRESAAGPGGTHGGSAFGAGVGQTGIVGGGGGGGFGGPGGDGAAIDPVGQASKGGAALTLPLTLGGGFGGGDGGPQLDHAPGGGGGGGIQLVSASSIVIGGGTQPGGINVGGCGGVGAAEGGGGGGSGGEILLQSLEVELRANGVLAANGGGGATANGRGNPGNLSSKAATAGPKNDRGQGGFGSAGAQLNGAEGKACVVDPQTCAGGGGGGGAGMIRIQTSTGTVTMATGATVSPALGSAAATAAVLATR